MDSIIDLAGTVEQVDLTPRSRTGLRDAAHEKPPVGLSSCQTVI